jgi:hypothetical protein
LLELYGIDASHLNNLVDGEALGEADEETLVKLLYRMPRVPLDALHRWSADSQIDLQLAEQPAEFRGGVYAFKARAKYVRSVALLPEIAERFEFDHYYQVHLELPNAPFPIVLCTREIPEAWRTDQEMDERSGAYGFFMKVGESNGSAAELVFSGPRAAWYPDATTTLAVTPDERVLADLGVDIGLFDTVRNSNRRPLRAEDRECFYQLLSAVGNASAEFSKQASRSLQLAALLQTPQSHHGQLATIRGTARRITEIQVPDRDVQERFGIDHYFQIDVFLPLGDEVIRLGEPRQGKESPTFTNSFPVTVCVLQLPADLTVGNDLRVDVQIPTAFFKIWAFRSEFVSSFDDGQLQVGPMFVGQTPRIIERSTAGSPYVGLAAGVLFLVALGGLWIGLLRWNQSDRAFRTQLRQRNFDASPDEEPRRGDRP